MDNTTLQTFLQHATARLAAAGVDSPALDARLLTAHALICDRAALLAQQGRELTPQETAQIETLLARREQREPVARILNQREFWSLPFALNEATLDPRPDSETLVETTLSTISSLQPPASSLRLLDLGTGSGCLLLALLHELPKATGLGLDQAPRAIDQARANAANLGLEDRATFRQGDWLNGLGESFDIILSNPPYIASTDIPALEPEVRDHDPAAALDGGADGLAPYRQIIPKLKNHLNPHGLAIFEVGQGQAPAVHALFREHGFPETLEAKDLGGIIRCVYATRPKG